MYSPLRKIIAIAALLFPTLAISNIDIGFEAYQKGDFATAFKEFSACSNDADCQYNLSQMYFRGEGVSKDYAQAISWAMLSAEAGDPRAHSFLGAVYENGLLVKKDPVLACKHYELSAKKNFSQGQLNLGRCLEEGLAGTQDHAKAFELYSLAAAQDLTEGITALALMYNGGKGVTQDRAKAFELNKKAALRGFTVAQNNLAVQYQFGNGVQRNYAWAVYWYAQAAQQGFSKSADNITSNLSKLASFKSKGKPVSLKQNASEKSSSIAQIKPGTTVYRLNTEGEYFEVYLPEGHKTGYVKASSLSEIKPKAPVQKPANSNFPPRPTPQPGRTVCATKCFNASCFRTYSDGRQVQFTARQTWDSFSNSYKYDSGGC